MDNFQFFELAQWHRKATMGGGISLREIFTGHRSFRRSLFPKRTIGEWFIIFYMVSSIVNYCIANGLHFNDNARKLCTISLQTRSTMPFDHEQ